VTGSMTYRASRSPSASSPADRNTVLTSAAGAEHTAKPSDTHSTDVTHLRGRLEIQGSFDCVLGPDQDYLLGPRGDSTLLERKVIGRLREGLSKILRQSTIAPCNFFSQSNLSWLSAILVPPRGPGKDLVTEALSQHTTRTHVC